MHEPISFICKRFLWYNIINRSDIMGLFSDKRAKEERQREDKQKFIERYKLEDFDEEEVEDMYKTYKVTRFSGIQGLVDQNWIIIKELNRLNKNFEELKKK